MGCTQSKNIPKSTNTNSKTTQPISTKNDSIQGEQLTINTNVKTEENNDGERKSLGHRKTSSKGSRYSLTSTVSEEVDDNLGAESDEESIVEMEGGNIQLFLNVQKIINIGFIKPFVSSVYVKVTVLSGDEESKRGRSIKLPATVAPDNVTANVDSLISIEHLVENDQICVKLCYVKLGVAVVCGSTTISVKELAEKSRTQLWLFSGSMRESVLDKDHENPTLVCLTNIETKETTEANPNVNLTRVISRQIEPNERLGLTHFENMTPVLSSGDINVRSDEIAEPNLENHPMWGKSCYIITQGTRGDVQPFVALARGLANLYGWTVYICTQMRYKNLVKNYARVNHGKVKFLPSGGDTEKRIQAPIARKIVNTKSTTLQAMMLARSEREFFRQEPEMFYWAKTLKPDFLCYSFVTANVAIMISEALKIPCIGFILQPTVVPSSFYQPIINLSESEISSEMEHTSIGSHSSVKRIKQLWENNIFSSRLDQMRSRHGLKKIDRNLTDFEIITLKDLPLVIPIKQEIFGAVPTDWSKQARVSDFIFLRGKDIPELDPHMMSFIETAKSRGDKLMVVCFSSMPLTRKQILRSAIRIIEKCPAPYRVSLIALEGNRPANETTGATYEDKADLYVAEGRLHIARGAAFNKLFPLMDFIAMHGGLGTTAECFAAGVPCMVTGVLLMDQRFWGKRVFELGVGPNPVHISDFDREILDILPMALDPNGKWAKRARQLSKDLFGGKELGDGVEANAHALVELCEHAKHADLTSFQR